MPTIIKKQHARSRKAQTTICNDLHHHLSESIGGKEVIQLNYQDHPRTIVPLVYGELKNGRRAVLCYKINQLESGDTEMVLRLYHTDKITQLRRPGRTMEVNRRIDYYLTKHFATVNRKC